MKPLNEILGFGVLTSPLWLLVILLVASIGVGFMVGVRFRKPAARLGIGFLSFVIVWLLAFGDEIAGRVFLGNLCKTQGGLHVYSKVKLPSKYWDQQGRPLFLNRSGTLDSSVLRGYGSESTLEKVPSVFPIERFQFAYVDRQSSKILATVTDFHFRGGWIVRNFSSASGGEIACNLPETKDSRMILLSIFTPDGL